MPAPFHDPAEQERGSDRRHPGNGNRQKHRGAARHTEDLAIPAPEHGDGQTEYHGGNGAARGTPRQEHADEEKGGQRTDEQVEELGHHFNQRHAGGQGSVGNEEGIRRHQNGDADREHSDKSQLTQDPRPALPQAGNDVVRHDSGN